VVQQVGRDQELDTAELGEGSGERVVDRDGGDERELAGAERQHAHARGKPKTERQNLVVVEDGKTRLRHGQLRVSEI
jgi:hypothetical protein